MGQLFEDNKIKETLRTGKVLRKEITVPNLK